MVDSFHLLVLIFIHQMRQGEVFVRGQCERCEEYESFKKQVGGLEWLPGCLYVWMRFNQEGSKDWNISPPAVLHLLTIITLSDKHG